MWLLADGLHDYLLAPAITGDDTPTRLLRAEALRHICRPALQDDHCRLGWPLSLHSETTQKESPWDEPGAFKELNQKERVQGSTCPRRPDAIPRHKSGEARIAQASLLLPLYLFITLSPTSCYAGCPLQYSRLGQLAQASLCRQMAHSQ